MLRSTIRNLLIESRYVSPMDFNGYACKFKFKPLPNNTYYFLFKPTLLKTMKNWGQMDFEPDDQAFQFSFLNAIKEQILGFAETYDEGTNGCNNAVEIMSMAAESPYGPTMYDVVLADNPGIMSDNRGTKPEAIKVYEKYLMSRADVEVLYLDSIEGYGTSKFDGDDCERNYNAFLDMREEDLEEIEEFEHAASYRDFPGPIDIPLDEEQVQGLSFHLQNYDIENEVEDLFSDIFVVELFELCRRIFNKSGEYVMMAAGKQYFSRKYSARY